VTTGYRAANFEALLNGPPGGYTPGVSEREAGWWWIKDPTGYVGNLSPELHTVVEHEDGTITVSPSILAPHWHGFLEHGVWRQV